MDPNPNPNPNRSCWPSFTAGAILGGILGILSDIGGTLHFAGLPETIPDIKEKLSESPHLLKVKPIFPIEVGAVSLNVSKSDADKCQSKPPNIKEGEEYFKIECIGHDDDRISYTINAVGCRTFSGSGLLGQDKPEPIESCE